jgi:biotin carboxyl carrier protein
VQYEVNVNGRLRQVVVRRQAGRFVVAVDGREWTIDAARVDAHTLSLLTRQPAVPGDVDASESYEVALAADPVGGALTVQVGSAAMKVVLNGRRHRGRAAQGLPVQSGPERLVAPMPGKIVRVLVKTGEAVSARQPLVVIEAMKMENELRAAADGMVAEIHVHDGQSVEAGTLLAVIHR